MDLIFKFEINDFIKRLLIHVEVLLIVIVLLFKSITISGTFEFVTHYREGENSLSYLFFLPFHLLAFFVFSLSF